MAWPNAVHARAEGPPARRPRAGMAIRVPRRSVECGGATAGGPFTGLRHRCAATRRNIRRHARRKTDCGGDRNGSRRTVTKRLLIVLMNTDPRNVEELGAPFYHAAVAAAMDYQVDVVCTANAGRILCRGVAETMSLTSGNARKVYDRIREGGSGHVRPTSSCSISPKAISSPNATA